MALVGVTHNQQIRLIDWKSFADATLYIDPLTILIGHLFGPLPSEMRNDTAFMDRIHCFLPGWNVPSVKKQHFTNHFGLVSDFLAECFSRMRAINRTQILQGRVLYGGTLSGCDTNAVNKTMNGLVKLLFPDPAMPIPEEDLEWMLRLAMESRRRIKE